jgi:hypothetical protein
MVLIAAAAMTAVVADNGTTAMCLRLLGDGVRETNPFSNMLIGHWGVNLTMTANAIWALVVVAYFTDRAIVKGCKFSVIILLTLTVIRGFAAVNNYGILERHL